MCAEEDSDLKCKPCREKDVELNPNETSNRSNIRQRRKLRSGAFEKGNIR